MGYEKIATVSSGNRQGEDILHRATETAREVFDDDLAAVFALGSLAHGGFAPLCSDIDVALVVQELTEDTASRIDRVRQLSATGVNTPLAARLSIFWSDWPGVHHGPVTHARLPAVDRLDLLDHGRLLWGRDERAGAVPPDKDTLVAEGARFACLLCADDYLVRIHQPSRLVADGVRMVTKAVLFPIRFLYTLHTGTIGHNVHAAEWYATRGRHPELAEAALWWRENDIADPTAATALLAGSLFGVYEEFFDAYTAALAEQDDTALVDDLAERHRSLHAQHSVSAY